MKFVKLGLGIRFDSDIFYEKETDSSDLNFGHTGMVSSIGWASIEKIYLYQFVTIYFFQVLLIDID